MILVASSGATNGAIGFGVVAALLIAAYFLFRSMNNQLKKIPPSYDEPATDEQPSARDGDTGELPPVEG